MKEFILTMLWFSLLVSLHDSFRKKMDVTMSMALAFIISTAIAISVALAILASINGIW